MCLCRRAAALSVLALLPPAAALAQMGPVIPQGRCGIVIASEATLDALLFHPEVQARRGQDQWLVETRNGRFAAIIGTAPMEAREGVVAQLKSEGLVGPDAFCTGADKVSHVADEPPDGPMPHFTKAAADDAVQEVQAAGSIPKEIRALLAETDPQSPRNPLSDIRISGIDWTMSRTEMVETLYGRGLSCTLDYSSLDCAQGEKKIRINPDNFTFNCEVINSCGLSLEDVGQAMLREFDIAQMLPAPNAFGQEYCGQSSGGDLLCISNMIGIGHYYSVKPTRSGSPDSITFD